MCVKLCFLIFLGVFMLVDGQMLKADLISYRSCRYDADCLENSYCVQNDDNKSGFCKCKIGLEMLIRNKTFYYCSKSMQYGESCTYDEECQVNLGSRGSCKFNYCVCSDGSHVYDSDKRCYETVQLYVGVCTTKNNCWLKGNKYANCDRGFCQCDPGMIPVDTLDDCIESKKLGESCSKDSDCSRINNAYCGDVCRCREGYSVSRRGHFCLKDATKFGDPCREDVQCSRYLKDSICSQNKTCICSENKHFDGNVCINTAFLGDSCDDDDECIFEPNLKGKIECNNNICTCKSGNTGPKCENSSNTIFTQKIILTQLFIIILLYIKLN